MTAGLELDPVEREAIAAQVNLSVLRRSDPAVTAIVASASHVALYQLNDGSEWCRRDVEGGLFLVERRPKPDLIVHRLVIVNRKSPDNYEDDLRVGNEDLELNNQMLMYHNSAAHIVGIWFYQKHEADRVYAMFCDISRGIHPAPETAKLREAASTHEQPAPDTLLERFFPNLKLTDGVAGGKMPPDAEELGAVESEATSASRSAPNNEVTAFKPTAEIDGAIVTASETPASDVVVGELITAANIALASSQPLTSSQVMGYATEQSDEAVELPKTSIGQKGNQMQRGVQRQSQRGGMRWTAQQKNPRRARASPQNKRKPGFQEGQEQQRHGQMGKQGAQMKQLGQAKPSVGVEGNRGGHLPRGGQTGQGSRWQRRGQRMSPVKDDQAEEKGEEVNEKEFEFKEECKPEMKNEESRPEAKKEDSKPEVEKKEESKLEVEKKEESMLEVEKKEESKLEVEKKEESKPEVEKKEESKPEVEKKEESKPEVEKEESKPEVEKREDSNLEAEKKDVKGETGAKALNKVEERYSRPDTGPKYVEEERRTLRPTIGQEGVMRTQGMHTQTGHSQAIYTQAMHTQAVQTQAMYTQAMHTQAVRTRAQNMHAQNLQTRNFQEARYREMHRLGGRGNGDIGNRGNGMMRGGMGMGGGARHYGGGAIPAPMPMMMPTPMPYQMYMQQQQYLANMHQQMQAQSMSANQQQQQRQFEVAGGVIPGGHGMGRNGNGDMTWSRDSELNERKEAGKRIGRGITEAEREGIVGHGGGQLDREGFRAVVQRMLTDRKLFDYVYGHYVENWK